MTTRAKTKTRKQNNHLPKDMGEWEYKDLERWLRERKQYWQRKLRLQDWSVEIEVRRPYQMPRRNDRAQVQWDVTHKHALIYIKPPVDLSPPERRVKIYEAVLVHELLHLHFAVIDQWPRDSIENTILEQAIESISLALTDGKVTK